MEFNLPLNALIFCSLSLLVILAKSLLWPALYPLHLDKVTAGPFSNALYLLLLLGKSFRAWQLRATTMYYHRGDREEEKQRRRQRERGRRGICEGASRERTVCVCLRWTVCACVCDVGCFLCKSKAGMKFECFSAQSHKIQKYTHSLCITHSSSPLKRLISLFRWLWSLSFCSSMRVEVTQLDEFLIWNVAFRPATVHLEKGAEPSGKTGTVGWGRGLNHLDLVAN